MEHEKELKKQLLSTGNRLLTPPSSEDELFLLLDDAKVLLSRVEQPPSQSVSNALLLARNALVAKELLRHSNMDVKVAVASCITEITRITAPDAPYDDELLKEIFQMIVEAFAKLDDVSDRLYMKRVSILETVAKVRLCVVMLDLECDDLILEMFHHFLKTVRDNHVQNVFISMKTIMTVVLDESDEISSELISCLLLCVKIDNKDFLRIAKRLVESVITNCAKKLRPYLMEAVQSMGTNFTDYGNIVNSICQECYDVLEKNGVKASREFLGSLKTEAEVGCPGQVAPATYKSTMTEEGYPEGSGRATYKFPNSVMCNGSAQIGNSNLLLEPIPPNKKNEHTRRGSLSENTTAATKTEKVNLDLSIVEVVLASVHSTRKRRGHKLKPVIQSTDTTDRPRIDTGKEAEPHRRTGGTKDVDGSLPEGPSGKVEEAMAPSDHSTRKRRGHKLKPAIQSTDTADRPRIDTDKEAEPHRRTGGAKDVDGSLPEGPSGKVEEAMAPLGKKKRQPPLEDSLETKSRKTKSRRKHGSEEEEPISTTSRRMQELGETLVGSKIKVWWPDDNRFYHGIVDLFDPIIEKHTILYSDGGMEILRLKDERWEFVGGDASFSGCQSSRPPKKGKRKCDSAPRETNMVKQAKSSSSGKSKGEGTPLDGGKHSGDALKSPSDRKGRVSKPGIKLDETTPTAGSKSKEKRRGKSKDDTSRISSKPKGDDTPRNLKDDAKKTRMEMKMKMTPRSDGDAGEVTENHRRDIVEVTEEQRARLAKVVKGRVVLDPVKLEESRNRWRNALVGKFLGKKISIESLRKIIERRWNCSAKVSVTDLMQSGYYCFKFECSEDMLDIWEQSPWTFNDKILVLKPWSENFHPERDVIDKALVWIRLPGLPLECWQEEFLLSIASGAGRPVRVDMNSLPVERGRLARVCVEVDLTEIPVKGIHVGAEDDPNQFFQTFVYENLPKMCYNCGKVGHLAGYCSTQNPQPESSNRNRLMDSRTHGPSTPIRISEPANEEVKEAVLTELNSSQAFPSMLNAGEVKMSDVQVTQRMEVNTKEGCTPQKEMKPSSSVSEDIQTDCEDIGSAGPPGFSNALKTKKDRRKGRDLLRPNMFGWGP